MAYNPWVETAPTDASDADQLGAVIRQLKADIRERMNSLLAAGGKWDTDDPIVLDPALGGAITGLKHYIPFCNFYLNGSDVHSDMKYGGTGANGTLIDHIWAALGIGAGCTITQIDVYARITGSGTGHAILKKLAFVDATADPADWTTVTTLDMPYNANSKYNVYSATGLSILLEDAMYAFACDSPNPADMWKGIRITYNRPSLAIDI